MISFKDLSLPVPYHETMDIIDSSKVRTYLECPRKYFYEYILGWRLTSSNIHLIFGESWHKAMECLIRNGYDKTNEAFREFLSIYEQKYKMGSSRDIDNYPKNSIMAAEGIKKYSEKFASDTFTVEGIEISGASHVDIEGTLLFYRLDLVIRDHLGIWWICDHKTGSRFDDKWASQWDQSIQIGTYLHALHTIVEPTRIGGAIINGAFFYKRKADPIEFYRIKVVKTPNQMADWLWIVQDTVRRISADGCNLSQVTSKDTVMKAFCKNPESCSKYFGCHHSSFCSSWSNPLRFIDKVPIGFEVTRWDPRREDLNYKPNKKEQTGFDRWIESIREKEE